MRSHSDGVRSDVYRIPMLIGESESLYNCKMHDLSSFSQRYHFLNRLLACYSFEPKANLPLKIIVLDDTMTDQNLDFANGQGGFNTNQLNWLVGELEEGQAQEKLMIIAAHIPIELIGMEKSTNSVITSSNLLLTLHQYPNLILRVAGHMHRNNVKAQLSIYNDPEYDFWEVECPSLRDFPQEFRTFEILRNTDNTISIVTTDIDPEEAPGSCADRSEE